MSFSGARFWQTDYLEPKSSAVPIDWNLMYTARKNKEDDFTDALNAGLPLAGAVSQKAIADTQATDIYDAAIGQRDKDVLSHIEELAETKDMTAHALWTSQQRIKDSHLLGPTGVTGALTNQYNQKEEFEKRLETDLKNAPDYVKNHIKDKYLDEYRSNLTRYGNQEIDLKNVDYGGEFSSHINASDHILKAMQGYASQGTESAPAEFGNGKFIGSVRKMYRDGDKVWNTAMNLTYDGTLNASIQQEANALAALIKQGEAISLEGAERGFGNQSGLSEAQRSAMAKVKQYIAGLTNEQISEASTLEQKIELGIRANAAQNAKEKYEYDDISRKYKYTPQYAAYGRSAGQAKFEQEMMSKNTRKGNILSSNKENVQNDAQAAKDFLSGKSIWSNLAGTQVAGIGTISPLLGTKTNTNQPQYKTEDLFNLEIGELDDGIVNLLPKNVQQLIKNHKGTSQTIGNAINDIGVNNPELAESFTQDIYYQENLIKANKLIHSKDEKIKEFGTGFKNFLEANKEGLKQFQGADTDFMLGVYSEALTDDAGNTNYQKVDDKYQKRMNNTILGRNENGTYILGDIQNQKVRLQDGTYMPVTEWMAKNELNAQSLITNYNITGINGLVGLDEGTDKVFRKTHEMTSADGQEVVTIVDNIIEYDRVAEKYSRPMTAIFDPTATGKNIISTKVTVGSDGKFKSSTFPNPTSKLNNQMLNKTEISNANGADFRYIVEKFPVQDASGKVTIQSSTHFYDMDGNYRFTEGVLDPKFNPNDPKSSYVPSGSSFKAILANANKETFNVYGFREYNNENQVKTIHENDGFITSGNQYNNAQEAGNAHDNKNE